jgi:NTE family protein
MEVRSMQPIRTLILSGGGGRGAFHAGVYKYLQSVNKPGVDAEHSSIWKPDIVVGTSIGAVNGAAIVQGISADELESIWLQMREHDIQALPPGMRGAARWIANLIYKQMIGVMLPQADPASATSPTPDKFWPPLPLLPPWLAERLIGRWINLLDTGPLRRTLIEKLGFNAATIAHSSMTFLITATNVQTGERMIFSNRKLTSRVTGELRSDVAIGITVDRILASCSIPLIYPWTFDPETKAHYWDGAVVANTPLGAALDAARSQPAEIPMEVLVVMMTPWWESGQSAPTKARELPTSFNEAITWTLDWALLASFRDRLRVIDFYNMLAEKERASGIQPYQYRQVKVVIIAPKEFYPAARIIDYDQESKQLIQDGLLAAQQAFMRYFPGAHP